MLPAILLNLCQEQSPLNAEEGKEGLDPIIYNILELLSAAEYLLGSRPRA
jgi:hypothetical protein